jgi:hypothetical protein
MDVLTEMLASRTVTIGFNLSEGGLDVLVPIDLQVYDAEIASPQRVMRKRPGEATKKFINCLSSLWTPDGGAKR